MFFLGAIEQKEVFSENCLNMTAMGLYLLAHT